MTDEPHHNSRQDRQEFASASGSLWRMTLAPTAWATQFVISYAAVSLACAKGLFDIEVVRVSLVGVAAIALAFIGWHAWRAWKQWEPLHAASKGQAENRQRFLGHATFLIAVISAIGTIFTSLPLFLLEGCQ